MQPARHLSSPTSPCEDEESPKMTLMQLPPGRIQPPSYPNISLSDNYNIEVRAIILRYALPRSYNRQVAQNNLLLSRHSNDGGTPEHGSSSTFEWTSNIPSDFPHGRHIVIWERGNAAVLVLNRQLHREAIGILYGENMFTFEIYDEDLYFHHMVEIYYGVACDRDEYGYGVMSRKAWHESLKEATYRDVVIKYGPRPSTDVLYRPALHKHIVSRHSEFSHSTGFRTIHFPEFRTIRFVSLRLRPSDKYLMEPVRLFADLFRRTSLACMKLEIYAMVHDWEYWDGGHRDPAISFARSSTFEAISPLRSLQARRLVVEDDTMCGYDPNSRLGLFLESEKEPMAALLNPTEWRDELALCVRRNWEDHRCQDESEDEDERGWGEDGGWGDDWGTDDGDGDDEGDGDDGEKEGEIEGWDSDGEGNDDSGVHSEDGDDDGQ